MAEQFKEQGGVATMDPSPILRWMTSRLMTRLSAVRRLDKRRRKTERARVKAGKPHIVEYFHQVEDGYSHLAAQMLPALQNRYDIELVCHLVTGPSGKNLPEPQLLLQLSRHDAYCVAAEYGLQFPSHEQEPDAELAALATSILAVQDCATFAAVAEQVGEALWSTDRTALQTLADKLGCASAEQISNRIDSGNNRLQDLQHYSGAMFHYGGEWYWGVDRLYHLEKRLAQLGADKQPEQTLLMPRPPVDTGPLKDDGSLTLEVFPSLRSPYTAVSFDRAIALARETGVKLAVRPVLPMVMRGVPATRQKGIYIFTDAAREAREAGVPYGNFYDPIGDPARRAYSLYPWACEQEKGVELISAFLHCAFAEGVNTNTQAGLRKVVQLAGLDWAEAQKHIGDSSWQSLLEDNRQAMYESGLWGVPSFRLLDPRGEVILALWGQDRLWLFARAIQRQLARSQPAA